jgi:hypothetical protein
MTRAASFSPKLPFAVRPAKPFFRRPRIRDNWKHPTAASVDLAVRIQVPESHHSKHRMVERRTSRGKFRSIGMI